MYDLITDGTELSVMLEGAVYSINIIKVKEVIYLSELWHLVACKKRLREQRETKLYEQ